MHHLQQLLPDGQDAVDLRRRERGVQEPRHPAVGMQLAELVRHLHELVVVDPHVVPVLVHRRHHFREPFGGGGGGGGGG